MTYPVPTPIYRIIHIGNLPILLRRRAIHAPNSTPQDGLVYRTIHNAAVQANRRAAIVACGSGGTVHDYLPFYFGPLSVMLLNLKTGRVPGYNEGQEPLIYLKSTVQAAVQANCEFVFTDGHGLASFTMWYDDLSQLSEVDWPLVNARYWSDRPEDNDRQRRKQAEFLIHGHCSWSIIEEIGVLNPDVKKRVEETLAEFPGCHKPNVTVRRDWYYN
ncbi:type II toxin-antitoxin system toxin DNA ADP-ribosyl transferase DarT [Dongia rigui]|uniref:DUF4433 domain-containing protein n=1 Tax=Dongia rigui TaxID=940149 RepID=A0ABU5E3A9_9PROT|nr:DUF4433 domain-containing protein [Dongia rigui]MDY0874095.1 DUF4433 domain-containing protein [Dongia rigui]